jgi:hypothetical protein
LNVAAPGSRMATKLTALGSRLRKEAQHLSVALGATARRGSSSAAAALGR